MVPGIEAASHQPVLVPDRSFFFLSMNKLSFGFIKARADISRVFRFSYFPSV